MKTVIAVPRGGDPNPERDRLWEFCRPRWESSGFPIIEGDGTSPDGYNRAAALNSALNNTEWDTAVIIDADIVVARTQVTNALLLASIDNRLTLAYTRYTPLTKAATTAMLRNHHASFSERDVATPPGRMRNHVSSCLVVPRGLWDTVGGMDERFVGWGCEDRAFHRACSVFGGGVNNAHGDVYHLWHTPARRTPMLKSNQTLEARYMGASTRQEMRQLLDER